MWTEEGCDDDSRMSLECPTRWFSLFGPLTKALARSEGLTEFVAQYNGNGEMGKSCRGANKLLMNPSNQLTKEDWKVLAGIVTAINPLRALNVAL